MVKCDECGTTEWAVGLFELLREQGLNGCPACRPDEWRSWPNGERPNSEVLGA